MNIVKTSVLIFSVTVLAGGCASKESLRTLQADLQNSVTTTRKELKAEIEAAKKQEQEETQKSLQKLSTDIDTKAIKALTDQKEKIDALSGEMKAKHEALAAEVQQLRQDNQKSLQQVQAQLMELYRANQQILHEFKELRNGVQVTYGGVLDYLKVEEALLKSSLNRVQSILHGVGGEEAHHVSANGMKPDPAVPPAAPPPASPVSPPPIPVPPAGK